VHNEIRTSSQKANRVIETMNAAQCRMARAALQLGVRELAAVAKVSPATIVRFEASGELRERTVDALRSALEAAGIEFIAENGGGPGVRLRKVRDE
jgi:hypothetical protein